jgi:hypothetical protein
MGRPSEPAERLGLGSLGDHNGCCNPGDMGDSTTDFVILACIRKAGSGSPDAPATLTRVVPVQIRDETFAPDVTRKSSRMPIRPKAIRSGRMSRLPLPQPLHGGGEE